MLTPAQVAHYETFGFLLLRRIFTAAEMADITREANEVWREDHERQPENPYQIVVPFVEERPRMTAFTCPLWTCWVRSLSGVGRKATRAVSRRRASCSGTPTGPIR